MKTIFPKIFIFSFFLLLSFKTVPQEKNKKAQSKKGLQQLSLIISHSHIKEGENANGGNEWIVVPSWSLDYNYWISSCWAIGIHSDIMTESYKVKSKSSVENAAIERTRPIAMVPATVFKPTEHSSLIVGLGKEFAPEKNLTLLRVGYEYGLEIGRQWELCAGLTYDLKFNNYDTWTLGLGISKSFRFRR